MLTNHIINILNTINIINNPSQKKRKVETPRLYFQKGTLRYSTNPTPFYSDHFLLLTTR